MEFRIFLPILQPEDSDWLPEQSLRDYNLALESLDLPAGIKPETRSDLYFVTPAHVGLKFRHGERLEIKIRDQVVNGMERWSKAKLGREPPAAYRREIAGLLRHFGHPDDVAGLPFDDRIELMKSRRSSYLTHRLSYEACHLEVPVHSTPAAVKGGSQRDWFSLAIEGDEASIVEYLSSPQKSERMRCALRCVHDTLKPVRSEATARKCIPVVSGYPQFVRYISDVASVEEVQTEIVKGWDNLVKQLNL